MAATQTRHPTLTSIAPRFAVGNLEQALAFYGQLGFVTTYQDEGFAIVERDGIDLHLNSSEEPPKRHSVCWIGVTNIEALYQEVIDKPKTPGAGRKVSRVQIIICGRSTSIHPEERSMGGRCGKIS